MFRRCPFLITLCLFLTLSACGSDGPSESTENQHTSQQVSANGTDDNDTQNVLESIYYNRRTPSDFYRENQPDPSTTQTIRHIKNIDILDPLTYDDTTPRYELCANDFSEALAWSTAASTHLGSLVDNSEHTLYYQFTYTPISAPEVSNLQRIFKCNIFDRSSLDIRSLEGRLGYYKETEQNSANIKLLIEYLWSFTIFNNYGNAILTSLIDEHDEDYILNMEHARLQSASNIDPACDHIDTYLVSYRVNKVSGDISVSESYQQTINSRFEDGQISVCGD